MSIWIKLDKYLAIRNCFVHNFFRKEEEMSQLGAAKIIEILKNSKYGMTLGGLLKIAKVEKVAGIYDANTTVATIYTRLWRLIDHLESIGVIRRDGEGKGALLHYMEGGESRILDERIRKLIKEMACEDYLLFQDIGQLKVALDGSIKRVLEEKEVLRPITGDSSGMVDKL